MLKRARELGDHLTVAVSTDDFNAGKHKQCVYPYEHRARIVEAIRYVDLVIPEESWQQKTQDVREHGIDVFVIGDDWEGEFDFLRDLCRVIYLPRTQSISTTEIRDIVKKGRTIGE